MGAKWSQETLNILWTKRALDQLGSAHAYLEDAGSPLSAGKQAALVTSVVEHLADFPELGKPGRLSGTRELVIQATPYVVAYRIRKQTVELLAVLHGARRWPINL